MRRPITPWEQCCDKKAKWKTPQRVCEERRLGFALVQTPQEPQPTHGGLHENLARPLGLSSSLPALLLVSPAGGGDFDVRQADRLTDSDVDTIGNYEQFPSYALHGSACHALSSAMLQELCACICCAAFLMASLDTTTDE